MQGTFPKLFDADGNLNQPWYIHYTIIENGKQKRIRVKGGINRFSTKKERYRAAQSLIDQVAKKLYNQTSNEPTSKITISAPLKTREAFDAIIIAKQNVIRSTSMKDYKSTSKVFLNWLESIHTTSELLLSEINTNTIIRFLDYLVNERKVSNTTRDNYLQNLTTIFNNLKDRGLVSEIPTRGIKKLPHALGRNLAYPQGLKTSILRECKGKDPYLFIYIQFIYYMYLRPTELRRIRVGDIDLFKNQIVVRPEVAKNKKLSILDIPDHFLPSIRCLHLEQFNPSFYLFTNDGTPGSKMLYKNYFSLRYKKITQTLNVPEFYTLYSWKHTGVVDAYNAGLDIKSISRHCRHHSLEMTDIYLKSLGLYRNEAIVTRFPKIE
jgi:integrase